jgi:hypothetical protein
MASPRCHRLGLGLGLGLALILGPGLAPALGLGLALGLTLAVAGAVCYSWVTNRKPEGTPTPEAAKPIAAGRREGFAPPPSTTPSGLQSEPIRVTSSVMPGMPLIRSTPAPPAAGIDANAPPPPAPGTVPSPEATAVANDLDAVRRMFGDFRTRMGGNPVGTNAEIMKALMGNNPAQVRLGPPDGQRVNANGELLDRWGTPYFFHQLSKDNMEIRSAGPDAQLWTADDLVGQ